MNPILVICLSLVSVVVAYCICVAVAESYDNYARGKRLDAIDKFNKDLIKYDDRDHD